VRVTHLQVSCERGEGISVGRGAWDDESVLPPLQNKGRVDMELIKPAVDWRKTGSKTATMTAAKSLAS